MVTDLLSVLSNVRPLAEHALVADDSNSEIVNSHSVVLATHDFRRHVAWGSRCVFSVLRVPNSSDAHIRNSEVTFIVKNEIFRLNVAVNDRFSVQEVQAQ